MPDLLSSGASARRPRRPQWGWIGALAVVAAGCSWTTPGTPPTRTVSPPVPWTPTAVSLVHATPTALSLPDTVRPGGAAAPSAIHPPAPFRAGRSRGGSTTWSTTLPVAPDLFPSRSVGARTFGFYPPDGLEVLLDGQPLRFKRHAASTGTWGYTETLLLVTLEDHVTEGGLDPTRITLRWPEATAREANRHHATADARDAAFVQRTEVTGDVSAAGLLLAAPATATWAITPPERAVLSLHPRLLPPVILTPEASDGATLVVEVTDGAAPPTEVLRAPLAPGVEGEDLRADLSRWAGRSVSLTLRTEPGATPTHDLVFVEDPVVFTPSDHPKRVVMAFLDTVRADHLGVYGHTRPTSPMLDAFAADAMVLDQQRSVSPWTLPSARAVLSGHQPEAWFDVPSLPDRLAAAGFHTEGIVANAYLGPLFAMDRGFSRYTYVHGQVATTTVDQALAVLERYPDRDLLLYVQFMEAHLPYDEPRAYRGMFEPPAPAGLRLTRSHLVRTGEGKPGYEAIRDYTLARYDQNIRWIDDELSRLFGRLGEDDGVVVFADHGEEFWDHGGFEHGHSFYDELLQVPTLLRHPTLPAGRTDVPTSLLDVAPTVLGMLGLPTDPGAPGQDLGPALRGDAGAVDALRARPQTFGRPLYDGPGWAVLHDGQKFLSRDGREQVWNLDEDPDEQRDIAASTDRTRFGPLMAQGLGAPVPQVWRLTGHGRAAPRGSTVRIAHPSGIASAWTGYDPRGRFDAVTVSVEDGVAVVQVPPRHPLPPAVFVQPVADAAHTTGLTLSVDDDTTTVDAAIPPDPAGARVRIVGPVGSVRAELDHAWAPPPVGTTVRAYDPAAEAALQALGYLDEDEDPGSDEDDPDDAETP